MPWKTNEAGAIVTEDGNPVWVHDDGKEVPLDGDQVFGKIRALTSEAASRRVKVRELEERFKAFEELDEDPEEFLAKAREALETVQNLSAKKLIDAGEVEKVKGEVTKAMQAKIDEAKAAAEAAIRDRDRHVIGGSFASSKFIAERLAIPSDLVEAKFGKHFTVRDGKLVGLDENGSEIYSREKPGEVASFDEALAEIVERYPHRDQILRSKAKVGGGTPPGSGGGAGSKQITRTQFDTMSPVERTKYLRDGGAVTD